MCFIIIIYVFYCKPTLIQFELFFSIFCILSSFKPWYGAPWGGVNDTEACRSDIELYLYISRLHLLVSQMKYIIIYTVSKTSISSCKMMVHGSTCSYIVLYHDYQVFCHIIQRVFCPVMYILYILVTSHTYEMVLFILNAAIQINFALPAYAHAFEMNSWSQCMIK
jgi:hypothetical protein